MKLYNFLHAKAKPNWAEVKHPRKKKRAEGEIRELLVPPGPLLHITSERQEGTVGQKRSETLSRCSQMKPTDFSNFLRFYLFIFRKRGREGEREGEKHQRVVASCAPPTGDLACNPGMPGLGIKPGTLCFTVWCSIHWATPARADFNILNNYNS